MISLSSQGPAAGCEPGICVVILSKIKRKWKRKTSLTIHPIHPIMQDAPIRNIDSADMRHAGRELLSVALMDARNHTLHLAAQIETALGAGGLAVPMKPEINPPLWTLGHIGWFQEWWIARNLQCHQGAGADPSATRLASIEPNSDPWWNPAVAPHDSRWDAYASASSTPDTEGRRVRLGG